MATTTQIPITLSSTGGSGSELARAVVIDGGPSSRVRVAVGVLPAVVSGPTSDDTAGDPLDPRPRMRTAPTGLGSTFVPMASSGSDYASAPIAPVAIDSSQALVSAIHPVANLAQRRVVAPIGAGLGDHDDDTTSWDSRSTRRSRRPRHPGKKNPPPGKPIKEVAEFAGIPPGGPIGPKLDFLTCVSGAQPDSHECRSLIRESLLVVGDDVYDTEDADIEEADMVRPPAFTCWWDRVCLTNWWLHLLGIYGVRQVWHSGCAFGWLYFAGLLVAGLSAIVPALSGIAVFMLSFPTTESRMPFSLYLRSMAVRLPLMLFCACNFICFAGHLWLFIAPLASSLGCGFGVLCSPSLDRTLPWSPGLFMLLRACCFVGSVFGAWPLFVRHGVLNSVSIYRRTDPIVCQPTQDHRPAHLRGARMLINDPSVVSIEVTDYATGVPTQKIIYVCPHYVDLALASFVDCMDEPAVIAKISPLLERDRSNGYLNIPIAFPNGEGRNTMAAWSTTYARLLWQREGCQDFVHRPLAAMRVGAERVSLSAVGALFTCRGVEGILPTRFGASSLLSTQSNRASGSDDSSPPKFLSRRVLNFRLSMLLWVVMFLGGWCLLLIAVISGWVSWAHASGLAEIARLFVDQGCSEAGSRISGIISPNLCTMKSDVGSGGLDSIRSQLTRMYLSSTGYLKRIIQ